MNPVVPPLYTYILIFSYEMVMSVAVSAMELTTMFPNSVWRALILAFIGVDESMIFMLGLARYFKKLSSLGLVLMFPQNTCLIFSNKGIT